MTLSSTEQRRRTIRKLAIAAAALAVTVLPSACDSAYADDRGDHSQHTGGNSSVVPVGETDEASPPSDEDEAAAGDGEEAGEADGADQPADDNDRDNNRGENRDNNNRGDNNRGDNNGGDKNTGDNNNGGDNNTGGDDSGLDVLGTDCSNSDLEPHDGFELAPRCVETSFGEVASEDKSPSLLITQAPDRVKQGEDFTIEVSTRNLIRDRFLGAAAGGYYKESSFLNEEGIQRGHFHTACRMLESVDTAPDAAPEPEFFLATQDNGGGAEPDNVTITVTGLPASGTAQCAVWAGDGSHRVPMMQRANQTPAFDAVRINVE